MIKESGIDFKNLPEEEYDAPFGISTGAGVIFGASGGVMEAALRTAYEILTGKELEKLDFTSVRGLAGVKEAEVEINGKIIKVAVVNTLGKARQLLEKMKNGEVEYHFVEFMACPGGCIGGGGQPIPTTEEVLLKRMEAIYEIDYDSKLRKSHENPAVKNYMKIFSENQIVRLRIIIFIHIIWQGINKIYLNNEAFGSRYFILYFTKKAIKRDNRVLLIIFNCKKV